MFLQRILPRTDFKLLCLSKNGFYLKSICRRLEFCFAAWIRSEIPVSPILFLLNDIPLIYSSFFRT